MIYDQLDVKFHTKNERKLDFQKDFDGDGKWNE